MSITRAHALAHATLPTMIPRITAIRAAGRPPGTGRSYGSCPYACHGPPPRSLSSGASGADHVAEAVQRNPRKRYGESYGGTSSRGMAWSAAQAPSAPRARASAAAVSIARDVFENRGSVEACQVMEPPGDASVEPRRGENRRPSVAFVFPPYPWPFPSSNATPLPLAPMVT